jgi:outer membrane protein OmpA-like peptidoglycan-associated protein
MSTILRAFSIAAVFVAAGIGSVVPAAAQTPGQVRVIIDSARILRWLATDEVILHVRQGTTLEVLDELDGWYWVVLPRDAHGTRKVGWIRTINVEPFTPPPTPKPEPRKPEALLSASPSANALPTPSAAEDKVTITDSRGGAVASSTPADGAKAYTFEDVYFERNRFGLLPDDMPALRAVLTALKADPSLVVDIEGHTCNLGTTAYNLALGLRRANAVKDYLVSEGISPARLHTISLGETQSKHDNSREDTRRLNRRVALVPNAVR